MGVSSSTIFASGLSRWYQDSEIWRRELQGRALVSKIRVPKNFFRSLIAVVSGNAIYFLLMPVLPLAARHEPKRLDLGLVIDAWLCLAVYWVLALISQYRASRTKHRV
jgi:hypothetical protein